MRKLSAKNALVLAFAVAAVVLVSYKTDYFNTILTPNLAKNIKSNTLDNCQGVKSIVSPITIQKPSPRFHDAGNNLFLINSCDNSIIQLTTDTEDDIFYTIDGWESSTKIKVTKNRYTNRFFKSTSSEVLNKFTIDLKKYANVEFATDPNAKKIITNSPILNEINSIRSNKDFIISNEILNRPSQSEFESNRNQLIEQFTKNVLTDIKVFPEYLVNYFKLKDANNLPENYPILYTIDYWPYANSSKTLAVFEIDVAKGQNFKWTTELKKSIFIDLNTFDLLDGNFTPNLQYFTWLNDHILFASLRNNNNQKVLYDVNTKSQALLEDLMPGFKQFFYNAKTGDMLFYAINNNSANLKAYNINIKKVSDIGTFDINDNQSPNFMFNYKDNSNLYLYSFSKIGNFKAYTINLDNLQLKLEVETDKLTDKNPDLLNKLKFIQKSIQDTRHIRIAGNLLYINGLLIDTTTGEFYYGTQKVLYNKEENSYIDINYLEDDEVQKMIQTRP